LPPAPSSAAEIRRHPPVWLFCLLPIAGAVFPFVCIVMPFLLRREGIAVSTIGGISALALLPLTVQFAWAPVADMWLSRRNWIWVGNLAGAALLFVAILLPRPKYLTLFVVLLAAGNLAVSLAFTAIGGLMAVLLPDGVRGKAAGWYQAGNMASLPFLGGASLWLIERVPLVQAAAGIALLSFLPSLSVLLIEEPRRSLAPSRAAFRGMFEEIRTLLKRRQTWLGLLLFLSPITAGAAFNLFTSVGGDYHASPRAVLWVTGLPGGVIAMAAGALVAGAINDFFPRRLSYICLGSLVALTAAGLAAAPIRPATFCVGGLIYEFATAMVWTSSTALALELGGADPLTAGTRMALFSSATLVPVSYMTWLDGQGDHTWGVRGLFGTDAALGLGAAVLLFALVRMFWGTTPKAQVDVIAVDLLSEGNAGESAGSSS